MTSLDNHTHDGYCVHGSGEIEVLDIEDYYGMDDFAEEGGFHCEDDDIMVEVLGSDVYVDGVCGDGNIGDRCFVAGVASGGELDTKLWPHGSVGGLGEGVEGRRQGLESRAESVSRESGKDLRTRDRVNDSASDSPFKPDVARSPVDEVDQLRHNGCDRLLEVQSCRELSKRDGDEDEVNLEDEVVLLGKEGSVVPKSPHRFRHDWNDITDRARKERTGAELMADSVDSHDKAPSSRKKHRVHDPTISSCIEDVEKPISLANDISISSSGAKPFLNLIGSHTGSLESNGERSQNGDCALLNGFEIFISESGDVKFPEHSSSDDFLEQLQFAVDNPLEGHEESIVLNRGTSEIYQFEDTNDSYWTDRIIETNSQDQQYYEYEGETRIKDLRSLGKSDMPKESFSLEGDCVVVDDNCPAELVLIFPKTGSFPVAATLNKTLKMFGPLKESETQVDRKSNRARVVFRKFGDAKVAFSSAQKYSIFGPLAVKYQLNHPISDPSN